MKSSRIISLSLKVTLLIMLLSLVVVGCNVSEEQREELNQILIDNEIIPSDLVQVDVMRKTVKNLITVNDYYYIYKDTNDKYMAIVYSQVLNDEDDPEEYNVMIYDDVHIINDNIDFISEEDINGLKKYYHYDKVDKYTENSIYSLEQHDVYNISKYFFFFKTSIQVHKENDEPIKD